MDNTMRTAFAAAVAAATFAFLQTGCVTGGGQNGAEEAPFVKKLLIGKAKSLSCTTSRLPYKLGIARYTMSRTPFERVLDIVEALDCHCLSLIEGTIARDATDAQIAEYKDRLAARGIEVDTLGPVYYDDEKTVEDAFSFAKRYGMDMISVVPFEKRKINGKEMRVESEAMLDVLERMVRKYDIKAAIHNHGPDIPLLFPTGESVIKRIEGRDKRIGFCFDVGHQARFGGGDPVKFIREHADRIYDIHLKNIKIDPVRNLAKEGPRGELDIPGILTALADVGYSGVCHVEYEKDHGDNLVQLAESFGYYRGVCDAIKVKAKMKPAPEGANTLTGEEKSEGWKLAWDGKTFDGWLAVKGAHVEHWLNGVKVVEYDRGTPAFKAAVKASKYADWGVDAAGKPQDWGEIPEGRILLQDHSDSTVSFCNLKIKEL